MPRPPDAGFFGRDETLLALDRAFDTGQVVLLHAFAGAGKTSTAAEFARWYSITGGLHHPDLGTGPVLWSSFEHHLPPHRLLDAAGDAFAPLLEANGIHWQAITSTDQRKSLVLQILGQMPVLWVWDNTEPVTGFPPGTPSTWTQGEQEQIAAFLRDLAQQTKSAPSSTSPTYCTTRKTPTACLSFRKPSPSPSASRTQPRKACSPPAWATPT